MLKRFSVVVLALVVVSLLAACGSSALPSQPTADEVLLAKYPALPVKLPMGNAILGKLGLRKAELTSPVYVFRHWTWGQGGWHWHYEKLEAGVGVAVDKDDRPWYEIRTAARVYVPAKSVALKGAAPAKGPPPQKSKSDKEKGGFPWPWLWAAVAAAALAYLIWRYKKRDEAELNRAIGPDPDDDLPGQRRPAVATDPDSRPDGRFEAICLRIAGVEREVANIHETVAGLEDRVVTRLEPVVKQAAEGGGKARAQALLAERIVELSADPKSAKTIAALTRILESIS